MPLYTIQHATPLKSQQKADLAQVITVAHSTRFGTPRVFVNVQFDPPLETFVGGKPQAGVNLIQGQVRSGPSRTQEDWDALTSEIAEGWDRIVVAPAREKEHAKLHAIFVMGGMASVIEQGFLLPTAGGDADWMKRNWGEFQRRADGGNEMFRDVMEDIKKRGLITTPAANGH